MQMLQVRDAPLFAHAIFYNMDLELHPGPTMNIYGPVHCNTDMYLSAVNSVTFHEGVTAHGKVLHGKKQEGNHTSQTGDVNIKDVAGNSKDMYIGGSRSSDSSYIDSKSDTFREDAAQRWDGNVEGGEHGVPTLNPIGIKDYVPDDPFTGANELENHAYSVIEPILSQSHPDYKGEAVRKEKFAYKAGLILKVEGSRLSIPSKTTEESVATNNYHVTAWKYDRINPLDPKSPPIIDGASGLPKLLPVTLPPGVIGGADSTLTRIDPGKDLKTDEYAYKKYSDSDKRVDGGMYDHREDRALDMISIDVGALRKVVDDGDAYNLSNGVSASDLGNHHWSNTYDPVTEWNGVVYVQFPTDANSGGRIDKVVKGSDKHVALQTINAKKIPNPAYTIDPGLTLATNAPLYMVGHFNADGVKHTDDAWVVEPGEPPAAVAADTLTVLSEEWLPGKSNNRKDSYQSSTGNRRAKFTEVSAAILTGLKPTIPDAAAGGNSNWQSGGAHNFPRFLEKWSGEELSMRGSLVALFESEVHDMAMPDNFSHYYSPPLRDWGFNDNFRNGLYPPGTPNVRNFRRIAFRDMTKSEYEEAVAGMWTGGPAY